MFAPVKGRCPHCNRDDISLSLLTNNGKTEELKNLLNRSVKQLEAWQKKYGENNPAWLPPSGEVKLLEDIAEALDSVKIMQSELDKARKLTHEQLNTPFTI